MNSTWLMEFLLNTPADDVECFFSILQDTVGKDFTLKQVGCLHFIAIYRFIMDGGRFMKKLDPDLLFFYYTNYA